MYVPFFFADVVVQPQFSRIDVNEGDGSVTVCAQASNVINPPVTVNYETRSGSPGAQGIAAGHNV